MFTTNVIIKSLTALLLVLPVGGYALGTLAASSADDDAPRQTIQLEQAAPSTAPAERGHHRHPGHQRGVTGSTTGTNAGSTGSTEPVSTAAEGAEDEATSEDVGDDSSGATRGGHVETIVPRYHESGESGGSEPGDDATTAATTDDGGGDDDQGDTRHADDEGSDDHGGDRQDDHHGADRDGGGR